MGTGYSTPWNDAWMDGEWRWALVFMWWPTRTDNGNLVWLTKAYHGMRGISGPGTPDYLHKWMTPEEFTWFQLTQS